VSIETLDNLMTQFQSPKRRSMIGETKLFPTLYVGEHEHGLFAVPSLVDEQTMMISPAQNGHLLIEGPRNVDVPPEIDIEVTTGKTGSNAKSGHPLFNQQQIPKDKSSVLLFGYYQVPEYPTVALSSNVAPFQLTTSQTMFPFQVNEVKVIEGPDTSDRNDTDNETVQMNESYNHKELMKGIKNIKQLNTTFIFSTEIVSFLNNQILPFSALTVQEIENKEMKLAFIVFILTVIWFIRFVKYQFKMWEKGFGRTSNSGSNSMSKGSVGSVSNYEITASPVELDDGTIKVGNISFDPLNILGKGCEGTFVYKGKFDNRDVAVKRVLAACFSIADREVELLRESDEHPNVVRYFCMEQCRQFRYIALELCVATLQDYVEGRYSEIKLDIPTVFRQAVQGLAHLHALDIAHRDIKPQNVLISTPGKKGDVRAMISDFGLCKKLKVGRMSFSRRSGVAGTEGWIAPEMLLGHRSTTCMVDIFSLGCVYYYLMTNGKHPFGENFHRQANILSGKANMELLDREKQNLDVTLIEKMVSFEPNDRPPALALLKHPVFWGKDKILTFLQDVSDRVDKEEDNSFVLNTIERFGTLVTKGDWQEQLDPAVRNDLRKHRTYKGKSVRDLLRAIRNKKHHYRELTDEAKLLYGKMPGEFADYWTKRFPRLLPHSYNAMQCVKYENNFTKYYHKDYDYVPTRIRQDGLFVSKSDLSEADADIFTPKFLDRQEPQEKHGFVATGKPDSLVSNWSQLDSGNNSRLEDFCVKENMSLCERDPSSQETDKPMYPVEAEAKSDRVENIEIVKETEVEESICPVPEDTRLPDTNTIEETNLCDKEVIESSPCDKENLNPSIPDESEPKKKNKKRRKHQKKNRVESPGTQEDT
jgi:serine/threonine-protein kinase/endoribonuclease IRE1